MNLDKMKEFIERWNSLYDSSMSFREVEKDFPNKEIYFRDMILNEPKWQKAEERLSAIEVVDREFRKNKEREKQETETNKIREERNKRLSETDHTQLADSPFSTKEKTEMREYRKYLREIPQLYKRQQILELKVMCFEEWKENKPRY